jgi:hypothetical protein
MLQHRIVRTVAVITLVMLAACGGNVIEDVASAYRVSRPEAEQMVARVADEATISSESAASRLLEEAGLRVRTSAGPLDLAAFLHQADEVASDAFDQAVSATYCHAILTYRATGSVDPNDLYQTLSTDFGSEIAGQLWHQSYIGDAIGIAQSLAQGNPSSVALMIAEMKYCP